MSISFDPYGRTSMSASADRLATIQISDSISHVGIADRKSSLESYGSLQLGFCDCFFEKLVEICSCVSFQDISTPTSRFWKNSNFLPSGLMVHDTFRNLRSRSVFNLRYTVLRGILQASEISNAVIGFSVVTPKMALQCVSSRVLRIRSSLLSDLFPREDKTCTFI